MLDRFREQRLYGFVTSTRSSRVFAVSPLGLEDNAALPRDRRRKPPTRLRFFGHIERGIGTSDSLCKQCDKIKNESPPRRVKRRGGFCNLRYCRSGSPELFGGEPATFLEPGFDPDLVHARNRGSA